jgi:hypothetical protein
MIYYFLAYEANQKLIFLVFRLMIQWNINDMILLF